MAMTPAEIRRRKMNMLMAMSYAAFASARSWTPANLFAAGEVGAWYDPSDFNTMFQDSAGTTPVTAVEQPVGLIRDKSGRGNHASQATSTSRPVLRQENGLYYLEFDGTDDSLATSSIDFSATDKMTVFAGVRKLSDAATNVIFEFSADSNLNDGAFGFFVPATFPDYTWRSRGTAASSLSAGNNVASPITHVVTGVGAIGTDQCVLRLNASQVGTSATDQGTGNYGNYPLYIGRRGGSTLPFTGRLYSLIIRGAQSTADQISRAEAWVDTKTAAY